MVGTRTNNKKKGENVKNGRRGKSPSASLLPPAKKIKSRSVRRVQFDANPPQVHEITPLFEKPTGVVRMPELSRAFQEDMESPPVEIGALIQMFADDSIMHDIKEEHGAVGDPEASIQFVDPTMTYTKPPTAKVIGETTKGLRPVPTLVLDTSPNRTTDNKKLFDGPLTENGLPPLSDRHMLSSVECLAFYRGKCRSSSAGHQLWSQLFGPRSVDDFIGKSKADYAEMVDWLGKWHGRMSRMEKEVTNSKSKQQNKRRKRRRSSAFFEDELLDDDDEEEGDAAFEQDEDFQPIAEQVSNPAVICGPTGCGKSVLVYEAARASKFDVIEIPACSTRDGQALKQKIAGALESHNVQCGKQPNILTIFGRVNGKCSSENGQIDKKARGDFSLVLIDECDLVFDADQSYWQVLKQLCAESRVPIVLTCNDSECVLNELGKGENGEALEVHKIHMERPPSQPLAKYLRHWILGFTSRFHKNGALYQMITSNNKDPRAVLNTLHFGLWSLDEERRRSSIEDSRTAVSLLESRKRAKILAQLDASFGPAGDKDGRLSLLAKCSCNLNFDGDGLLEDFWSELDNQRQTFLDLLAATQMEQSDLVLHSVERKNIVQLACLRSQGRPYSVRETCLDQLPCLMGIHHAWRVRVNAAKQQSAVDDSNEFALLFSSPSSRRDPPHPFNVVDPKTGTMLDPKQCLSSSIQTFQFP